MHEILKIGPKCGVYDKDRFNEYVKSKNKQLEIYKENSENDYGDCQSNQSNEEQHSFDKFFGCVNAKEPTEHEETKLVRKYLRHFCEENNGSLSDYSGDFSKWFIAEIERVVKVTQSKDGFTSLSEVVTIDEYKEIADRVVIKFSEQNKEFFEIDEEVSLQVTCKNI